MEARADNANTLFEWKAGQPFYRGLHVEHEDITVAGRTFRIAGLRDAADLLDHDDFARHFLDDDRAPYGMELWPAAPMMAEHVLLGEAGNGRSALDLGCGLALVSMAATLRGWNIVAADHEPTSLAFARYNAALNGVTIPAFEVMNWHRPPAGRRFERIFGADILYQLVDHVPILICIRALLASGGVALIADPRRGVADRFESLAREHDFGVNVLPCAFEFRTRGRIKGRIFRLSHSDDRST